MFQEVRRRFLFMVLVFVIVIAMFIWSQSNDNIALDICSIVSALIGWIAIHKEYKRMLEIWKEFNDNNPEL